MARATIQRRWPDGEFLAIEIRVDESSFPDAIDEATSEVLRCYREALGITLADVETDE